MDTDILAIRLSMEAQCWDEMVDRLAVYLKKTKEIRLRTKLSRQMDMQFME